MASRQVTIVGQAYLTGVGVSPQSAVSVTIVGEEYTTGLEVGGGPMPGQPPTIWPSPGHPAHPIAPGGPPPGYWGGVAPPLPTHPIAPGGPPPTIWPSPGHPAHPIVIPPPTEGPEPPPEGDKPPPADGGWGYVSEQGYGWGYFPGPTEAAPKQE